MTDFSNIRTLRELEYQTERMQRRSDIQWERIEGHISFAKAEIDLLVRSFRAIYHPIRDALTGRWQTVRMVWQGLKYVFGLFHK